MSSSKGNNKDQNPTLQPPLLFRRMGSGSIIILKRDSLGDPDFRESFDLEALDRHPSGLSLRVQDSRALDPPYLGQEGPGIPGFEKMAGRLRRENQRSLIILRLHRRLRLFGNLP